MGWKFSLLRKLICLGEQREQFECFFPPKYVLLLQYTSTHSPSAHRVTAIVTATIACITGILFVFYNFWSLRRVKSTHEKEMKSFDEGFVEKIKRKKDEPALEPGSAV